jgi:hypothetical protein
VSNSGKIDESHTLWNSLFHNLSLPPACWSGGESALPTCGVSEVAAWSDFYIMKPRDTPKKNLWITLSTAGDEDSTGLVDNCPKTCGIPVDNVVDRLWITFHPQEGPIHPQGYPQFIHRVAGL